MKTKKTLYSLCECGVLVAAAVALSFLKVSLWAQGGSVDLVTVPLVILAYRHGFFWGLGGGMVFGLLDCILGGGIGWGIASVLLDYVLAYGMMAFAASFRKKGLLGLELGAVLGCLARFLVHFVAGITLWRIAVGSEAEIFGMTFGSEASVWYSLVYNGSYMAVNLVLALLILPIFYPVLEKRRKDS